MSAQTIVSPQNIEKKLVEIWEALAKKNKIRACLFNLIVFTEQNERSDSFREVVLKVIENYPCRILFLSKDVHAQKSYLKTAVSVVDIKGSLDIACDTIDIGFSGQDEEEVFYVILPHIVPDLPTHLLWLSPPSFNDSLFVKLEDIVNRVIVDSGSSESFLTFIKEMQEYLTDRTADISDLGWTRLDPWRALIASEFRTKNEKKLLEKTQNIKITYNAEKNAYIPHPQSETLYFIFWLASRLNKPFLKKENETLIFEGLTVEMKKEYRKKQRPGSILQLEIFSDESSFSYTRHEQDPQDIHVKISSKEKCSLPRTIALKKNARGASLSREMLKRQTSKHYLQTMDLLKTYAKNS